MRGTRQASAVATALTSLPGFRSAQEIHAELRRQGETVGLTTVYRHLQVLSEQGVIDTIRDSSGEALYRQCGSTGHHHHLTCRVCHRSVEVEGRAVEQWAEKVAAEYGGPVTTLVFDDGVHILNNVWYKARPAVADWLAETL